MATVQDVMTKNPVCISHEAPVASAARAMRDYDIGDVLVIDDEDKLVGIVTDRDVAVRGVAEGLDLEQVELGEVCSSAPVTVSPSDEVHTAARLMRDQALRRLPVLDGGRAVGIVSLGDLSRQPGAAAILAGISTAPPNQ
jgi:signal-transduction protein with cAMP-binding, CBS, and nucleotidyltransferase domain